MFPDWTEALAASGLPERVRRSTEVTVRWYLSFCRRSRVGVCHQSAREFIAAVERLRQPAGWQVEAWREAIRWFFRTGRALERSRITRPEPSWPGGDATGDGVGGLAADGEARSGLQEGWEEELQRQLRVGHSAYRTEQTYMEWARRFVHFHARRPLASLGERDLKGYLDHLAVAACGCSSCSGSGSRTWTSSDGRSRCGSGRARRTGSRRCRKRCCLSLAGIWSGCEGCTPRIKRPVWRASGCRKRRGGSTRAPDRNGPEIVSP